MSKENGFKETEIGLIPEDWDVVKLEEVSEKLKAGGTPRTNIKEYWNGDIPLVKVEDVASNEKYLTKTLVSITKEGLESSSAWIVPKDSILLSMYGTAGEVVINKIPVAVTQNILGIIKNYKITTGFLYYALIFSKNYGMSKITDKTIFKYFTLAKAKGLLFSLPSTPEQQKITFVLSKIQQAIEQQDKIIAKTKELKRSLMHRLFTYGLRGEELKETEIGLMPESWEVFSISQKCLVKGSTMALTELPLLDTKNTQLELVHGIKVSDMNTVGNEKSINRANIVAYLSKQDAVKKTVPQGSIAFPKRGAAISTNKKRLTTSWTVLDPNLIAIIPNEDIDAEYLYYWFLTFDLKSIQDPGPTPQLNKKDVCPIRFPCPSIEEQKQISSFLSIIDSRHSLAEQKKNCLKDLFKSMLQLLMTGQVRVKDIDFGVDCE